MRNKPRNEHEAWGVLWATLDAAKAAQLPDRDKPPTTCKGPFTYQPPTQPTIAPYRAFLRLAGLALIATLCALIPFG